LSPGKGAGNSGRIRRFSGVSAAASGAATASPFLSQGFATLTLGYYPSSLRDSNPLERVTQFGDRN